MVSPDVNGSGEGKVSMTRGYYPLQNCHGNCCTFSTSGPLGSH